jgi:hypothetical protein
MLTVKLSGLFIQMKIRQFTVSELYTYKCITTVYVIIKFLTLTRRTAHTFGCHINAHGVNFYPNFIIHYSML